MIQATLGPRGYRKTGIVLSHYFLVSEIAIFFLIYTFVSRDHAVTILILNPLMKSTKDDRLFISVHQHLSDIGGILIAKC